MEKYKHSSGLVFDLITTKDGKRTAIVLFTNGRSTQQVVACVHGILDDIRAITLEQVEQAINKWCANKTSEDIGLLIESQQQKKD